jgi:hypothetical protein
MNKVIIINARFKNELNVFKPICCFVKEPEAKKAGQNKKNNQHRLMY